MIITEVSKIDRMVEEILGTTKGVISVDMKDYALIKDSSSSLKAIKVEIPEMSEESIGDLDQALADTYGDEECNILLYIATLKSTENPITEDGAYDLDKIETILLCSGKNEYLMQYGEDSMEESYGGINTCGFINSDFNDSDIPF